MPRRHSLRYGMLFSLLMYAFRFHCTKNICLPTYTRTDKSPPMPPLDRTSSGQPPLRTSGSTRCRQRGRARTFRSVRQTSRVSTQRSISLLYFLTFALEIGRAFTKVRDFLLKQAHRPWIKCYLKRDEILAMIEECGQGLTEALEMFSVSYFFFCGHWSFWG